MTIDPKTIDSSETIKQLKIDARQYLPEVLKSIKKSTGDKWEEKPKSLEKAFKALLYGESAYQKIKVKFLYIALSTAENISAKIKRNPIENAKHFKAFSKLKEMFIRLDTENAYEEKKASDMRGLSRRVLSRIEGFEKDTRKFIATNDNYRDQQQDKAA